MQAWTVDQPGPVDAGPLVRVERELPEPRGGQLRVRIRCCGVCRTDLHLAEGDLPPRRHGVTPGHEIVGVVDAAGPAATRFPVGTRVGVPWLGGTDGSCAFCRSGRENLCVAPTFTGWDVDGGYADACLVESGFAYALPDSLDDEHAAPLLCAGIIGYRALRRAELPPGGALGIYGFGGSAHLTAQIALHEGARVHVLTRGEHNRRLAAELGVDSVGGATDRPPEPLDAAILFAPAGELVPVALAALDRGGTLAVAGIWLSEIPALDYAAALFQERQAAQRHRQHARRRRAVPPPRAPLRAAHRHHRLPDGRRPAGAGRPGARPFRRCGRPAQLTCTTDPPADERYPMKASDIMTRDVVTVRPDTPVREAVALLARHRITSLPVLDDDKSVVGIVSELDLLRDRMPHDPRAHMRPAEDDGPDPARVVGDVMTDTVICLSENADTADLAELLVDHNVRAVPIISGADLVGIVSRRDVLRTLLRDDTAILADVRERLDDYAGPGRWTISVDDGVVTLRGTVADDRQRASLLALARTVTGVVRVHLK